MLRFLSSLDDASAVYEPLHRDLAQKSQQALISAYFAKERRPPIVASGSGESVEPSVEEEALEQENVDEMSDDDEVASIVSAADFAGF